MGVDGGIVEDTLSEEELDAGLSASRCDDVGLLCVQNTIRSGVTKHHCDCDAWCRNAVYDV
jgi:hypothetical protein